MSVRLLFVRPSVSDGTSEVCHVCLSICLSVSNGTSEVRHV